MSRRSPSRSRAQRRLSRRKALGVVFGTAGWAAASAAAVPGAPSTTPGSPQIVQVRGRVVCLAEEMQARYGAELPSGHEHLWGIRADDGRCYTLLRSRYSEAIWLDARVREKELSVEARLFPAAQIIEVRTIRAIKDGELYDLVYWCSICAIETVSPEPCFCCQGPVELLERPARGAGNR